MKFTEHRILCRALAASNLASGLTCTAQDDEEGEAERRQFRNRQKAKRRRRRQ